jgi:large subunit ribosomal protein L10
MSKHIKQIEMEALKKRFQGVNDLVLLSVSGVNAQVDNQMRLGLRKKNIQLQVVKNSLARRVFDELGVKIASAWDQSTTVAWGAGSLAELSRELEALIKKNDKIKVKTAVSEGLELSFKQALSMPTRAEAVARVIGLACSPATRIASLLSAPASRVVGQIRTLAKKEEEQAAPPA